MSIKLATWMLCLFGLFLHDPVKAVTGSGPAQPQIPPGYSIFHPYALNRLYVSPERLGWGETQNGRLAAEELIQLLNEFSMARVAPVFRYWHYWLTQTNLPAAQYERVLTDATLGMMAFWRSHRMASLEQSVRLGAYIPSFAAPQDIERLMQAFSKGQLLELIYQLRPMHADYLHVRARLQRLQQLEQEVHWPILVETGTLKPGQQSQEIAAIASILQWLGDLEAKQLVTHQPAINRPVIHRQASPQGRGQPVLMERPNLIERSTIQSSQVYSPELVNAVKRFQRRHGIQADGLIGEHTRQWLNQDAKARAALLSRNSIRQGVLARQLDSHYIMVNIPAYQLKMVKGGASIFQSRVIVGRKQRPTPLLRSEISNVVVNPWWHVPNKILRKDLLPKILQDQAYLSKHHYQLLDQQGKPVEATKVDWSSLSTHHFPFRLRQRPGSHNALGHYTLFLPNDQAIYLHDTSAPELFERGMRSLSSGCVRVDSVEQLVALLLQQEKEQEAVRLAMETQKTRWIPLTEPVAIYFAYWTSWIDEQGGTQFREDIYSFDRDLYKVETMTMNAFNAL